MILRLMFVYGTLKRDRGNHRLLERAIFMGADEAPGIVVGPFPKAFPRTRQFDERAPRMWNQWIKGEVYAVDQRTLRALDSLEGHPHAYTRTLVTLRSGEQAEIYYWTATPVQRGDDILMDGEWRGYTAIPA